VTSLRIEVLKDAPEWKMTRERMAYTRQLQNSGVWVRIVDKKSTQYQPALVLIGADPNDDRKAIKKELLKRVNAEGHKVQSGKIEVQVKGFQFPKAFRDERMTIGMVVMVHKHGYDQTITALLNMEKDKVNREEYPVTYDIQMEDIRVGGGDVEDRFKNAYLSQVQYYLNRVWIKIMGIPDEVDLEKYKVNPEIHGGEGDKSIRQLILEDVKYIKENGQEYKNPVRKIQRVEEGGGWQLTGRKHDKINLAHFGYQILPELLKEWCGAHNLSSARIGMIPGMRNIQVQQSVSNIEMVNIVPREDKERKGRENAVTP